MAQTLAAPVAAALRIGSLPMKAAPGLGQVMAWTIAGVVLGAMAAYKTTSEDKATIELDDEDKPKDDRDT